MGMKLLPRLEITKAKSDERRREVEEGRKLSERVDVLRETVASEEQSLATFRAKTIEVIHSEIVAESKKRDELKVEVDNLLQVRNELLKPLDDEWEATRRQNYLLSKESDIISGLKKDLEIREQKAVEFENQTKMQRNRAVSIENLAYDKLREAEEKEKSAQIALVEAKRIEEQSLLQKEEVHRELLHRDILVSERESGVTMREQALAARVKENEEEIIRLNDQRQTLERAFKRLNINYE